MARLSNNPVEGHWDYGGLELDCECADFMAHLKKEKESFDTLWERHLEALTNDELVDVILSWPRGDGKAMYRIASTSPLILEHIPYGDAWAIEPPLIRGLRLADVQDMARRERKMEKLFQNRQAVPVEEYLDEMGDDA